jgi:hypothetical protein
MTKTTKKKSAPPVEVTPPPPPKAPFVPKRGLVKAPR